MSDANSKIDTKHANGELAQLINDVMRFCEARDWDQFHSPKEMAIGLITEAAELLEIFRFQSDEQMAAALRDPALRVEIADELADVFFFVLRFAGRTGFNLSDALNAKMEKNARKYPVEKSRGKNIKYDKL